MITLCWAVGHELAELCVWLNNYLYPLHIIIVQCLLCLLAGKDCAYNQMFPCEAVATCLGLTFVLIVNGLTL